MSSRSAAKAPQRAPKSYSPGVEALLGLKLRAQGSSRNLLASADDFPEIPKPLKQGIYLKS